MDGNDSFGLYIQKQMYFMLYKIKKSVIIGSDRTTDYGCSGEKT